MHLADETIITWSDVDVGTDVALSFQEANGCHAIWCAMQQPLQQLKHRRLLLRRIGLRGFNDNGFFLTAGRASPSCRMRMDGQVR